jgi:hypothetical protein
MKITSALIGIAALGGVALSSGAASAIPVTAPVQTSSVAVPAGYVCNEWGHCWHRHSYGYGYGYYHPHYWGGLGRHTATGITAGTVGIAGTAGTPVANDS